ncbi:MAG TPA: hypothetical protein VIR98_00620 [Candidatus Paceibacterota bacterium]|jgi:hypothetical protein
MLNRYLAPFFAILVCAAVLNFAGETYRLYDAFWWYDILMHALGGAWAGMLVLWLSRWFGFAVRPRVIIGGTLVIGLGWEVMELILGFMYLSDSNYLSDTALDLCMDVIGSVLVVYAWSLGRHIKKNRGNNKRS